MASRKKSLWGLGAVGAILLFVFKENAADFLEEYGLNRGWTLIEPAVHALASLIRLLGHPIMTHLYAVAVGFGLCLGVAVIAAWLQRKPPINVEMMTLSEVVDYLTTETEWSKRKRAVSDRDVQLELLDVLSSGRLIAYARQVSSGHLSAQKRIGPDYYDAVLIDTFAIRNGNPRPIKFKPGYYGDEFDDWQFERSRVEDVWPRPEEPRKGWRKRLFGE